MSWLALVLAVTYLAAAFGGRTIQQVRRTGDTGFRGVSGRPGSVEWWAGVLFAAAVVACVLGPVAAVVGLPSVPVLSRPLVAGVGLVVFALGAAATGLAQAQLGTSWRIGVDDAERTRLVRTGLFRYVRNPIFTAIVAAGLGLALMVPNAIALLGLGGLVAGVQLQVRVVEEPYLLRTHGRAYRGYAAKTGRFLPGVGRLDVA